MNLIPKHSPGAAVTQPAQGVWRMEIPSGAAGKYRLAQLDDYAALDRSQFPWQPPLQFSLKARVSALDIPGTWGFGFWNDPFSFSFGAAGSARRLPALPNAVWFFYASPANYLSLRDDLPAQGLLAATFQSQDVPIALQGLVLLGLPVLGLPVFGRLARRFIRHWVRQDAAQVRSDPTEWKKYTIQWESENVRLLVDDIQVLQTPIAPLGRLGLVIWIDNQYAAFTPDGHLRFGMEPDEGPAWLEVSDIELLSQTPG